MYFLLPTHDHTVFQQPLLQTSPTHLIAYINPSDFYTSTEDVLIFSLSSLEECHGLSHQAHLYPSASE